MALAMLERERSQTPEESVKGPTRGGGIRRSSKENLCRKSGVTYLLISVLEYRYHNFNPD